jgi:hypothetical protein
MARRWDEREWDELFRAHPPDAAHKPTRAACEAIGRRLDRTADAILWMWEDAERHRRGAASNTASERLIDYLDRKR